MRLTSPGLALVFRLQCYVLLFATFATLLACKQSCSAIATYFAIIFNHT